MTKAISGGAGAAASKRSKEEKLNKSVLNRIYKAQAFLNQAEKDRDMEYVKIMVKAAGEELEEALGVPGSWY